MSDDRAPRRTRVLVIVVLGALLSAACGPADASSPENDDAVGVALPVQSAPEPAVPTSSSATTSPIAPASTTAAPTTAVASDPHRTLIATANPEVERLVAYDRPDGTELPLPFLVPNPHQFGGPLTMMVTRGALDDDWVEVQLPIRPNGQTGWVPTADYVLSETRVRAEVRLAGNSVRVFDGPTLLAESNAVVGAEETPTPVGRFYVAAKKENTAEEFWLGPWALVLSSYSEVLPSFSGGLPVIAIHGTNHPELMGESITFGCVRVPNETIEFLADHVPVGAPVEIYA